MAGRLKRPVELGLAVHDFSEHGHIEELLEDHAIGDAGHVSLVGDVVQNDARAGEAALLNIADGEQDVIEAAETIVGDDDDGEGEVCCKVRKSGAGGEGYLPAACAFDEDMGVEASQVFEALKGAVGFDRAVFQQACGEGSSGRFEPDGIDQIKVKLAPAGVLEVVSVFTGATDEWLVADSIDS